ncbi:OsmC family peroxiredoxin [bacterium 3DAC]|nr:OsmC family protein [Dictyoglomota bacterium]UZN23601.1 OsmC family peroxiredoxin [bacterium 3DAC]
MAEVKFRVSANLIGKFTVEGKIRKHTLTLDEPADLGGDDKGPNPVELILLAQAGCILMVGRVVAMEMGITINSFKVDVVGVLNPEKFMGKPTEDRAGFKEITLKVYIDADADRDTLKKWLEIVEERCPVKDNLVNHTPVKVELA